MGRFHHHADGTVHAHDHDHRGHEHTGAERDVGDHSGYETGGLRVEVLEQILGENDRTAAANRADLARSGVRAVNVMSSPGAGKTLLLQAALRHLDGALRIGIVEGDIETPLDADRLGGLGAPVALVNTANGFGGECHLDAAMVRSVLHRLPLDELDLVVIENVGNLVCPAEFDVGESARVLVYAITEGEDKPLKYPVMFRAADLVVINKIDLLPYLDFDLDAFRANLETVHPGVEVLEVSARRGTGVPAFAAWLVARAS
ncbi:MAG: hydrogenase nickel incorporation protein HypB [Gaiella sp.]